MRWEIGQIPEYYIENCSESEIKYVEKYDTLLSNYSRKVGINISHVRRKIIFFSNSKYLHKGYGSTKRYFS